MIKKENTLLLTFVMKKNIKKVIKHAINILIQISKSSRERIKGMKEKPVVVYCNTGKKSKESC